MLMKFRDSPTSQMMGQSIVKELEDTKNRYRLRTGMELDTDALVDDVNDEDGDE